MRNEAEQFADLARAGETVAGRGVARAANLDGQAVPGGAEAGLIRHIEPAGAIVRTLVAETQQAFADAAKFQLEAPARETAA